MSISQITGPVERLLGGKPLHAKTYHKINFNWKPPNTSVWGNNIRQLFDYEPSIAEVSLFKEYTFYRPANFKIRFFNKGQPFKMSGAMQVAYSPDPTIAISPSVLFRQHDRLMLYSDDCTYTIDFPGWRYTKIGDEPRLHNFGSWGFKLFQDSRYAEKFGPDWVVEYEFEMHYSTPTINSQMYSLTKPFSQGAVLILPQPTIEYLDGKTSGTSKGGVLLEITLPLDIDYTYYLPHDLDVEGTVNFNTSVYLTLGFKEKEDSTEFYFYNLILSQMDLVSLKNIEDDFFEGGTITAMVLTKEFWPWDVIPTEAAILTILDWNNYQTVGKHASPDDTQPEFLSFDGNLTYYTDAPSKRFESTGEPINSEPASAYDDLMETLAIEEQRN